jgi:uncharacterized membrane protein
VNVKQYVASVVGLLMLVRGRRIRDERGLSQSAEGAILMGAAVAVALIIAVFLRAYVESHLPR